MDSTGNERVRVPQAAAELGMNRQAVREYVKKGELKGVYVKEPGKTQGAYYIYRSSIEEFKNRGMPPAATAADTARLTEMVSEISGQVRELTGLANLIVAAMGLKGGTHENT